MKYDSLKPSGVKRLKLPILNGGTDLKKPSSSIPDNVLCSSKNVWYKDGRLKTRAGLYSNPRNAVSVQKQSFYDVFDYHLTDTVVEYFGLDYRIAYSNVCTDNFMYVIRVYLVSSDVSIVPIGELTFLRFSSDEFKTPESIVFYTGARKSGGGIFALVTLRNEENYSDKNYNIYEINEGFDEWQRVYDYYIPTLSVNGRGNNYDLAHAETSITLPNIKTVESQNLLCSQFYCYYTSDGYSNMFRLPFSDLSSDTVVCRIYYAAALYAEWRVLGSVIADTKSFMGFDIMLEVDRDKGTLSFFKNGEPYAIPVMPTYNENNIKITAGKETPDGLEQVIDSKCSLLADGRIYLAGGKNGSTVMTAKCENPLYFPKKSTVDVGGVEEITALSIQSKKIIAFKRNETHYISLKKGRLINEIGLISDNDTLFKDADTLTSELISKSIGCEQKDTVCKLGAKTVWYANDRNVYLLDSIGFDGVLNLSQDMKISEFEGFAVSDGEYYILSSEDKAWVCDLNTPLKPKWYLWDIDSDISLHGGFYKNGTLYFICSNDGGGIFYVASLNSDGDTKMQYDDMQLISNTVKSESFIVTKNYALSGLTQRNTVESIYLALSGRGVVQIKVNGRRMAVVNLRFSTDDYDKGEYKTVELSPHLYDTERLQIELSSKDAFAVGEIEIFYRKMGV